MNPQLQDTFKMPYAVFEQDADGNPALDAGDSVSLTVDDSNKATIAPDATVDTAKVPSGLDPSKVLQTGFIVGGKILGTVTVTATFAHADGTSAPPPITDQIDIVSGPPVTGGISLGTPIPQ